jgi:DNA-binding CsgD family transcriptional regulator
MKTIQKQVSKRSTVKQIQPATDLPQSGIVLMDMSLRPIATDRGATNILKTQNRETTNGDNGVRMPEEILNAIRNRNPADQSCMSMHFLIGERKYRCRSYLIQTQRDGLKPPIMAVHFESDAPACDPIARLAADYHLTEREQEVLRGIALGLTTKELADRMDISPNTVKAFVRLIMIKLGVFTRTAIIGKLLKRNGTE